jgi:DNA-binding SARP family transcriptional activator
VFRGRTPVPDREWKSRPAKALVKLLAANDGRKVPRDVVLETLWPGADPDSSRQTLAGMLHRVRKLLAPGSAANRDGLYILQEGDLLTLDRDAVWTDIGQFLSHLETAGRLKAGGAPEKVVAEYEKAIELYQGDFLPEDRYEDWVSGVQGNVRGAYLKALEDAGDICDGAGEKNRAALFFEKLFLEDPCSEKACRWLMAWYLSTGRRGEALRVYERCQRALSKELDVEPDAKTHALYRSIIGG